MKPQKWYGHFHSQPNQRKRLGFNFKHASTQTKLNPTKQKDDFDLKELGF